MPSFDSTNEGNCHAVFRARTLAYDASMESVGGVARASGFYVSAFRVVGFRVSSFFHANMNVF